jgi:hypothetical protein
VRGYYTLFRWDSSAAGAIFTRLKAFCLLSVLRVKAFNLLRIFRVKAFYLNEGEGTRAASILRVPRNRDSTLCNILQDILCELE